MTDHTEIDDDFDPADYDGGELLSDSELSLVPQARSFTLVGRGGRVDILDSSHPLVLDGYGIELRDQSVACCCTIPECCCPAVRQWPTAEQAAAHHQSYVVWHRRPPVPLP